MSDIAIRVENLSKRYRIGGPRVPYKTMRETLVQAAQAPFRRLHSTFQRSNVQPSNDNTIWALKDVSFEVQRGDVVGIIGRNGAGKTTLLKILSRITEPTEGYAEIHGRVGSLLEVGTGFHPELTGRENIYLNGAILGMKRAEIERKFDEIVAFAEIEKFLDTPVKHYSSGMYVRLAFAVAAHLEPEILLVDEVLAVGDAAFQRKCLGKMGDVAKEGRTVLFVSHNMAAVANLCQRAFLLREGVLVKSGRTPDVITEYLHLTEDDSRDGPYRVDERLLREQQANDSLQFIIKRIDLLDLQRRPIREIGTGDGLVVRILYRAARKFIAPAFMVSIGDGYGVELARLSTMPISGYFIESIEGDGAVELVIEELPLAGGNYLLTLGVARANVEWILRLEGVVSLHVEPRDVYRSGLAIDNNRGLITLKHGWNLLSTSD